MARILAKSAQSLQQVCQGPSKLEVDYREILKTGLTPSASGSAYLELETTPQHLKKPHSRQPALKLACTVHGPKPLPRSAPFSSQLILSTRVKFAPFATRERKGYVPDPSERDLAAHLDTALRGVLLAERWPKSGFDVIVTVLEGEQDTSVVESANTCGMLDMMNILSGCITVASAAMVDAGIDSCDIATGGVAALVAHAGDEQSYVLDPCPSEEQTVIAACVVAYLESRDEITELWAKDSGHSLNEEARTVVNYETLVDNAVEAASAARLVLLEILQER
ncbi:uncharacterized protein KY384_007600 [Bacidia gigantensis]|uniref:uncharacterized protein n=1 Tax=Bacidia gigantensis TaxID=2732470 RepID=UPI001D0420E6|nr:uncharacterized protein KY384_007600 [Bacidia gigantensis]KAG8527448.1 hypothetical protein KY384_007600 [Bacidia gigantensis]